MICANCHKHISATVNYCAYCGEPTDNAVLRPRPFHQPPRWYLPLWVLALPLVPIGCVLGVGLIAIALKGAP